MTSNLIKIRSDSSRPCCNPPFSVFIITFVGLFLCTELKLQSFLQLFNADLVSENASQIQKQSVSPQADYTAFVNLNIVDNGELKISNLKTLSLKHVLMLLKC